MSECSALRVLSKITRITPQVGGSDKVFRLLCYSCQLFSCVFEKKLSNETIQKISLFSSQLSNVRTVNRFLGVFEIIEGLFTQKVQKKDILSQICYLQYISLVFYHVCEYVYWFNSIGVWKNVDGNKYGRYSCIGWLIYILLDFIADPIRLKREIYNQKENEVDSIEVSSRSLSSPSFSTKKN